MVFSNSAPSFSMVIFCNHSMTSAYAQALLGLYKNKGISIMYSAMIREDFFGGGKSWFVNNWESYLLIRFGSLEEIPFNPSSVLAQCGTAIKAEPVEWIKIFGNRPVNFAQKPLGPLHNFIKQLSNPADVILDAFAGTGSTSVAALQLHRSTIAIKSDPTQFGILTECVQKLLEDPLFHLSAQDEAVEKEVEEKQPKVSQDPLAPIAVEEEVVPSVSLLNCPLCSEPIQDDKLRLACSECNMACHPHCIVDPNSDKPFCNEICQKVA